MNPVPVHLLYRRSTQIILVILALATCFTFFHLLASDSDLPHPEQQGYVKPEVCAGCHRSVWETYKRTGMGRSFYRPDLASQVEDFTSNNTFYHQPSDSYFRMRTRDGKIYQQRYQFDFAGKQVNLMEKQVDYIMGSGNHARAYLYRTARGALMELPLAWYAEKGGYWAMNPGYDRPRHDGFRRLITYDCMFCHNAYPRIPARHDQAFADPVYEGELPQGIDCQRCHGPGARHVQIAGKAGSALGDIRGSILNPAKLSAPRQMEVCMACHLETTSFPLPNAIQRYERGPFSYNPAEPLGAFILNFDHAPGTRHDDKFELVSAAYRLRRSACFLKSGGRIGCTTCHNPHDIPHGEEASRHYTAVCRQCHGTAFNQLVASGKHTRDDGCVSCHMPARRTEDVVHAIVTDHYIQRTRPAGDLLAERTERQETGNGAYHGPVALYYPQTLPRTPENDLYLAVAQVKQQSNLTEGGRQLSAAIQRHPPQRAEFYFELAEALRENGQLAKAIPVYRQAIQHDPKFVVAMQKLGFTLRQAGQYPQAAEILKQAVALDPDHVPTWLELGLTDLALKDNRVAVAAFERVLELDSEVPEAHNNLGIIWFTGGDPARAEAAFREAIRIQPEFADAQGNLANLLSASGALSEAIYHFQIALRLRPQDAGTRYNYAVVLGRTRQFGQAQQQLEEALTTDPGLADAHELLADLLMTKGQTGAALSHYRAAIRIQPDSGRAQLGLGSALASAGDFAGALPHLQKAAAAADPEVRKDAAGILSRLKGTTVQPANNPPPELP